MVAKKRVKKDTSKEAVTHDEPPMEEQHTEQQADAIDAMNEDVPFKPITDRNLPHLHDLPSPEEDDGKKESEDGKKDAKPKKDKYDEAMEILDKYYDGVPTRNPTLEHEED